MNTDKTFISEQWNKGSKEAFSIVFKENYKKLLFEAQKVLKDEQAAKDAVQDLFARIWSEKLYRKIRMESAGSYLMVSIHNACLRKLYNEERYQQHLDGYAQFKSQYQEPITTVIDQRELGDQIAHAIEGLNQQPRIAFSLVYLEDKSRSEASDHMKISKNTFKSHLKIAMKGLQQKLKKMR